MRWIVHLFKQLQRQDPPPPAPIDRIELREQMTREDPDFQHVRDVHHEAIGLIGSNRNVDQLRDRFNEKWRESWRHWP